MLFSHSPAWPGATVLASSLLLMSCGGGGGGTPTGVLSDSSTAPATTAPPSSSASSEPTPAATTSTHAPVTQKFTSTQGGTLVTSNGVRLAVDASAIPGNTDGSAVPVTFSVEVAENPPQALPSNLTALGNVEKFGPDGFSFAWPLKTTLPLSTSTQDAQGINYLRYDAGSSQWVGYPGFTYETDAADNVIAASSATYSLGYDVMSQASTESLQGRAGYVCDTCNGAMQWTTNSCGNEATNKSCDFYFVAKSYKPKWDWQQRSFQNFIDSERLPCSWNATEGRFTGTRCMLFITGSTSTGEPATKTLFNIMQGDWEFCVTKSQWVIPGGSLPLPGKWTYDKLVPVSITQASHNTCWVSPCWSNVEPIQLPTGGTWQEPADMPSCPTNNTPTVPVGTGDFQATLTWVNSASKNADLDLHLYGPNDDHVYYHHKQSSDGAFELDRDWLTDYGDAVENIYSTNQASPSHGNYRLTVKHYSGDVPIDFNVRVINQGLSKTERHTFNTNKEEIEITTFSK